MKELLDIRSLTDADYSACAQIYKEGLDTGIASFETYVPTWEQWDSNFLKHYRYVAIAEKKPLGWIALTPFSSREVYRGVAEISLYVAQEARGLGVGNRLLTHLIMISDTAGFWTLQAKIFPQNLASIALFEKNGFVKVGVREKLGKRDGVWHDNVLMERRNAII